jgi:hypothetical protein
MGQQQLLLIVLGTIVVGVAVLVGINIFSSSSADTNRDQLISVLNELGSNAQKYYKKPIELGGGNRKFTGWKISKFYKNFEGGKIKVKVKKKGDEVTITATGTAKGRDGKKEVKVEAKVKSTIFTIEIKN